jgi:hypothetical protein
MDKERKQCLETIKAESTRGKKGFKRALALLRDLLDDLRE